MNKLEEDTHLEKIARIDENVKLLLQSLPVVSQLHVDSAVNKKEHRFALGILSGIALPVLVWIFKQLGITHL